MSTKKIDLMWGYKDEQFRRITGVKRDVFDKLVSFLREKYQARESKAGRKTKLSLEDMLLLTLEYLRGYRTYLDLARSYGISESSAYKNIKWVEDSLIKHPELALPGKKQLAKSQMQYEVILIDATESPIERPKKSRGITIPAKGNDIR
jgi:hypothetical protein